MSPLTIPVVASDDENADNHERSFYVQTNLVSDIPGMAKTLDPNLANPWGISFSATSPFWISNNHTGTSTLYNGAGDPFPLGHPLVVAILTVPLQTGMGSPTGAVFNNTPGFLLDIGKPAVFLFASEDGVITGWNPNGNATHAIVKADESGKAVYKGLALATSSSGPMLYATNFFAGTVDVFDAGFHKVNAPGGFYDPAIPSGYAPCGIRLFHDRLYVTYALQDDNKQDDIAGPGHGFVDVFDLDGHLLKRFQRRGHLNSPWGMAFTPATFGRFAGALLVGNFGNGKINAYSPRSSEWLGTLAIQAPSTSRREVPGRVARWKITDCSARSVRQRSNGFTRDAAAILSPGRTRNRCGPKIRAPR